MIRNRLDNLMIMLDETDFRCLIQDMSSTDFTDCLDFLRANQHVSSDEFIKRLERWFVDDGSLDKPKNLEIMKKLLEQCN